MTTLGPYQLNTIVTGDARVLAESIPDSSVDLIFTDPVYQNIDDYEWLAWTAARVLKPDRACLVWVSHKEYLAALLAMVKYLDFYSPLALFKAGPYGKCVGKGGNFEIRLTYCLWMQKGSFWPYEKVWDFHMSTPNRAFGFHDWSKDPQAITRWLRAFTHPGDLVADFFTGGGTVPAVAKMLGVNYWACEIYPETAEKARRRVELTQAPLFVMQPEQAALFAEATF